MAYGVEQLLGYQSLTESVRAVQQGLPDILPPAFFNLKETVLADKASHVETKGERRLARAVPYGSPGRAVEKKQIGQREFKLLNFREVLPFNMELFTQLRAFDSYAPQAKMAEENVRFHCDNFNEQFKNTRKAAVMAMLANGVIYLDGEGYILPTSSGASSSVDMLIPAINKNTITDIDGSTLIVTASWATASTDITAQVRNLKALAVKRTGYPLKYCIYGKNVAGYIANNNNAKAYYNFATNGELALQIQHEGKIPSGFMGLEWIPAQEAFFEQADGTIVDQFPADQITFFPDVTKQTYAMYEGTTLVPSKFGIMSNAMEAFKSLAEVVGPGGFATMTNWTQIQAEGFDLFLPRPKVPGAVFLLDTTP